MSTLASNNLNYFSPVEFHCRASQEESVYPKLPSFSKDIQQHIVKVLKSSSDKKYKEKIWWSDIILLTLLWFTNWPTFISLWNCFLSVKWTEVATAFLSIQSNAWNMYWGLTANLSSTFQSGIHIFWECYWNFTFLVKVVSFYGTVFGNCKCFPVKF